MWKSFSALGALAIFSTCTVSGGLGETSGRNDELLALVGGTVYASPTEAPIRDSVVLIEEGMIVAVGSKSSVTIPGSAQLLDCSGLTITAGFWNSHMHFVKKEWADVGSLSAPVISRQLEDMLTRYGFTSVFDLSSKWENTRLLRDRIESGELLGPRIRSTGEGLLPPGGNPEESAWDAIGWMVAPLPEVADARQASAVARTLLDKGVDGIKLFVSTQNGDRLAHDAMRAAAGEAHRMGKPVFAHPNSGADVLAAVRGRADIIVHTTPRSGPWDESLLNTMKRARIALTPTLTLWKSDAAVDQLRAWREIGGEVLFGTDSGAVTPDPSEEYALMAQAGMDFREILASLTTTPAERFGESRTLGRIAVGFKADLVALRGDPAENIQALADVQFTFRDGMIIYRAREPARSAAELLDLSIAYHDPKGAWGAKPLSLTLTGSRPNGPSSQTEIMTHAQGRRFRYRTVRNEMVIIIEVSGDTVLTSIDGCSDLSDEERHENRLTPDHVQTTRNYHEYLYGLPMKLRDPGTRIKPEAWRQEFQGKQVDAIQISYDPEVGKDTWQMFFDPKTHALVGYLFYHDLEKQDGEYITLAGEVTGPHGLRLRKG